MRLAWILAAAPLVIGQEAAAPYHEPDLLTGATMLEKLSRVSQLDLLEDTLHDKDRCAAAAALNAFLLLGGKWQVLARKLGIAPDFTYASVHRVQEALYEIGNVDGKPGITGGFRPRYDSQHQVIGWDARIGDESHILFDAIGLTTWPLYGPTEAKLNDKKAAVLEYFRANPNGVLLSGVDEDAGKFESLPARAAGMANHWIAIVLREGQYLSLDTWAKPGANIVHRLTEEQMRAFAFDTPITLFATKLR